MARPNEATEEVVREVMRFYFRERLGTIKCAHALLSRTSGDAASGADGDAWERAVTKMLDLGFEENAWRALDRHMSGASASGPEGVESGGRRGVGGANARRDGGAAGGSVLAVLQPSEVQT